MKTFKLAAMMFVPLAISGGCGTPKSETPEHLDTVVFSTGGDEVSNGTVPEQQDKVTLSRGAATITKPEFSKNRELPADISDRIWIDPEVEGSSEIRVCFASGEQGGTRVEPKPYLVESLRLIPIREDGNMIAGDAKMVFVEQRFNRITGDPTTFVYGLWQHTEIDAARTSIYSGKRFDKQDPEMMKMIPLIERVLRNLNYQGILQFD